METNASFYLAVRERFPTLAQKTDRKYLKDWGEQPSEQDAYGWFQFVANTLNDEMRREAYLPESAEAFLFIAHVFASASEEVRRCIDVSFVENLFWQVPPAKAAAYWKKLPLQLQALYVDFHSKPPI
ncbi:DUF7674 family protein [Pseudoduganella sp. S-14]|jgi:hypothetical protein|uniref:DUF7674 family protein n=1 Tax=Pseudoduganella sp. S-14 TaxID=3404065 RepID=UPI003CF85E98